MPSRTAAASSSTTRLPRPTYAGPDTPSAPFPIPLSGHVVHGFGRGSKQLGFPTANLPQHVVNQLCVDEGGVINTGIYYGWAQVVWPSSAAAVHGAVYPMVMSVGRNPFYANPTPSAEVHIIHDYPADFYDREMRVLVCGHVREERNYDGVSALIEDISEDVAQGMRSLVREAYAVLKRHEVFVGTGV